jgi:GntR family transcriptional regulator/MocR family aminotransferase
MRSWSFPVALQTSGARPLFVQISEAIASDIARGRLRRGDSLPGTRSLAEAIGVHRSTVLAAYSELVAQGWLATRAGGSTTVAASSPELHTRAATSRRTPAPAFARSPGYRVDAAEHLAEGVPDIREGSLSLWGARPDLRLVPIAQLTRAYRRVLQGNGRALLGYTTAVAGHPRLRAAIAAMLCAARGLAIAESDVLVTRGSQMALDLTARSLIRAGDVVAIENPGYPSALGVFARAGARIVPVPVDAEGIDVNALAVIAQRAPVRLVYVTPHHQYPTTVTLSPSRRLALLDLAERARFAVVEDDYDQEFHFDGRPVLPMASADAHGQVIYVGTLAKILAPGLRLGFVVAPAPTLKRMIQERMLVDRQGDGAVECAVAELLEDGEVQRHARRMRRIYHARRDALIRALDRHLAGALTFAQPAGGLALWARVHDRIDVEAWQARASDAGVSFVTGSSFRFDRSRSPHIRLGFAALDERELGEAARLMARAL